MDGLQTKNKNKQPYRELMAEQEAFTNSAAGAKSTSKTAYSSRTCHICLYGSSLPALE